jgi:hypothetical protein
VREAPETSTKPRAPFGPISSARGQTAAGWLDRPEVEPARIHALGQRCTPENIASVMELYPVGERFFQEFTLRQVLLNAAKNGCMDASRSASAFLDRPA